MVPYEMVMKYWNKTKEVRLRCWTFIQLPQTSKPNSLYRWVRPYPLYKWTTRGGETFESLKIELQRNNSVNKFYMCEEQGQIWFENAKDATWFRLKYAEILQ